MEVKQNGLKAWFLASRPKTLTGAMIPIMVSGSLAVAGGKYNGVALVTCFAFAALMQIAANLINDLIDFKRGTDGSDRLGPERACAQGWITPRAMSTGIGVLLFLALGAGCTVLAYSSLWLVAVGALCVVFAFLYTTIMSYAGWGDILVFVFFGLVPCCGTYYVATGELTGAAWLSGVSCGVVIDTLLIVNNYRDRHTDKRSNKRTLIVLFGGRFGERFYLWCGIVAWALGLPLLMGGSAWWMLLTCPYLILHYTTWRKMVSINQGKALNRILGLTSRNMFLFGLLLSAGILLSQA